VRVAEELHPLDAERARRVSLLLLADPGEPLGGHRAIARALVPVGDDHVGDLATLLDHLRDGAASAELRVVGVRRHDHDTLDLVAQSSLLSFLNGWIGATRAVLRPPTVQRVLAVPATTEPRAPFSGHPRSNACSRSPLQPPVLRIPIPRAPRDRL